MPSVYSEIEANFKKRNKEENGSKDKTSNEETEMRKNSIIQIRKCKEQKLFRNVNKTVNMAEEL